MCVRHSVLCENIGRFISTQMKSKPATIKDKINYTFYCVNVTKMFQRNQFVNDERTSRLSVHFNLSISDYEMVIINIGVHQASASWLWIYTAPLCLLLLCFSFLLQSKCFIDGICTQWKSFNVFLHPYVLSTSLRSNCHYLLAFPRPELVHKGHRVFAIVAPTKLGDDTLFFFNLI